MFRNMSFRFLRLMLVRQVTFLYCLVAAVILLIIYIHRETVVDILDRKSILMKIDETIKHHANSGACKQPNLPVYAPEMMKFVKYVPPIDCSGAEPDWVICENMECRIKPEIVIQKGPIKCTFTDIIRKDEYNFVDGKATYSDSYYKLIKSDTVSVVCRSAKQKWDSLLTSVRFDKDVWDRIGWEHVPKDSMKLNVLIFGLDSMSRNTVIRKLPATYKYLKEQLHALVLEGYNIIGDGTPQALTPILTGQTELELPETRKRVADANYVDVYPFIWNDFKKSGYVTGYLEEGPVYGTYTYRLKGFLKPPTDHYGRTYYMKLETYKKKWMKYCAGSVPRHKVMMDYIKSFFTVYKNKPKFMFGFESDLSHDDYNLVGGADKDIMNFLKDLHTSGALNNTLLIFMADHGHRFASIRNTVQGKMEERLPFFSFTFPPWFKQTHKTAYENFKGNLQTLVTPFDIHATLKNILHIGNLGNANMSERSLSLFSKISKERSCAQAYIEPHWCSCLEWNPMKLSEPIVQEITEAFVKVLNDLTQPQRKLCALLQVSAIYSVSKLTPNEKLLQFKKNHDLDGFVPDLTGKTHVTSDVYQIKVMLSPGDSLFEATITHNLVAGKMELKMEDISRINVYGNQARCIEEKYPNLRKYCYCI